MQQRELVEAVINHTGDNYTYSEVKELDEVIEDKRSHDFWFEFDGAEYRVIHEDCIWDIYKEGIQEITEDCYLEGKELPNFVAVDWEETAQNCMVDGYGHHFSSYDGSESEHEGWYVFRTN